MRKQTFQALAEKYMDMVYRVAYNSLNNPYDADDVTQEVFLRLLRTDTARSTEEKLCIVDSGANFEDWKAADGFTVTFRIQGDVHTINGNTIRDDPEPEAELELPGVKSLPAVTLTDPATGKAVLLSAIGLKLDCEDMDEVDFIAVEFADGTQYVVEDAAKDLDNSDYGLGSGSRPDMTLRKVFNRLVDTSQVTAVTVDGVRYE